MVGLLIHERHGHRFAIWSKPQGNTATFLKERGCGFVLQEATLISKAPLPVSCRGRGGAGLSLDGLGDVLDSRIAKLIERMLPSAAVQRPGRQCS